MTFRRRPGTGEYAEYYSRYVDLVPEGDIRATLESQLAEIVPALQGITEERSLHRYEPGKWSIRELVSHVNDTERVFAFRALWFARGFSDSLPSFDQDAAIGEARADQRAWRSHVEDFRAVRQATITLFRDLPDEAWQHRGVASGVEVSVRGLAWITAGHLAHHVAILRQRYLQSQ